LEVDGELGCELVLVAGFTGGAFLTASHITKIYGATVITTDVGKRQGVTVHEVAAAVWPMSTRYRGPVPASQIHTV
jgi:hypothetical protein